MRYLVILLAIGCHHAEPRDVHPCDEIPGEHPPRPEAVVEDLLGPRPAYTCKAPYQRNDNAPPTALCKSIASEEATPAATEQCFRTCQAMTNAHLAENEYRTVVDLLEQFGKQYDPARPCPTAARELWHCTGLPDLPADLKLEIRLAKNQLDGVRVEGPLVPDGASYLFTYGSVGTGCGTHSWLVQVEPPR